MPLFVAEIDTTEDSNIESVLSKTSHAASQNGGEFIESQVTANHNRVFAVLEHTDINVLRQDLAAAGLKIDELASVRLIGAELEDIDRKSVV